MKKLVLAHPCYGPLDPEINKALRVAVMSAASAPDVQWIGDVSTIREGWVGARNRAAKGALDNGADGIVWVDDDMLLPPEAIKRIVSYDYDFVTGIYYQKAEPYAPLVANWTGNGMAFWKSFPENTLCKADGCGFGIVYTSTKMIRDIEKLPEFEDEGWFNQFPPDKWPPAEGKKQIAMSEDFSFCMRAKEAGYQLYVDTGVLCGHMVGPKYMTQNIVFKRWAEMEQKKEDGEKWLLEQKEKEEWKLGRS